MKKTLFVTLMFIVIVGMLTFATVASAEAATGKAGDNITWTFDINTGVFVLEGTGKMYHNQYGYNWEEYNEQITTVVVGEGITSVSYASFKNCYNITSVTLPDSLEEIGGYAFNGCFRLETINLKNVKKIENYAFAGAGLTSLTLPDGLNEVGYGSFKSCVSLAEIMFNEDLKKIDSYAFDYCRSLVSVKIPDSVTEIGGLAFYYCTSLREVTIGKNVEELGGNVFQNCISLKKVVIPDKIKEIKINTFRDCTALECVYFGASVESIAVDSFAGCEKLKTFELSPNNKNYSLYNGVLYSYDKTELKLFPTAYMGEHVVHSGTKIIGEFCAYENVGITSIVIPSSVERIKRSAFRDSAILTNVVLSEGLKRVDEFAFEGTGIASIVFPLSLEYIDGNAVDDCLYLKDIWFYSEVPEIDDYWGFNFVKNATVHYPLHKEGWGKFALDYFLYCEKAPFECEGEHVPLDKKEIPATCKDTGLTAGVYCKLCGFAFEPQEIIPAKGHTYEEWNFYHVTTHGSYCVDCGYRALGEHDWDVGSVKKEPTCKDKGEFVYTCSMCGGEKKEEIPTLTEHTYESACDEECNVCGMARGVQHAYGETAVFDENNHWLECEECSYKSEVETHLFDENIPETEDNPCATCDYVKKAIHQCVMVEKYDSSYHWKECIECGEKTEHIVHAMGKVDANGESSCSECEYAEITEKTGEITQETVATPKPDVNGEYKENRDKKTNLVTIVVATSVAGVLAGVVVFLVTLKKKK